MKRPYLLTVSLLFFAIEIANGQSSKRLLFNHQNLEGWYAYEPETGKHDDASEVFSVENNMIRLYGNKVGYLMSVDSFKEFRLTIEFRWNTDKAFIRKSETNNSGAMYLVPSESPDMIWPKGIQFQIKEGNTGDFILLHDVTVDVKNKTTVAGKSIVSKRFKDSAKPVGEWNTLEITFQNQKIKQRLNNKLVNKGTKPSVSEGRILLQYEGAPIDFRRVEIKEL